MIDFPNTVGETAAALHRQRERLAMHGRIDDPAVKSWWRRLWELVFARSGAPFRF